MFRYFYVLLVVAAVAHVAVTTSHLFPSFYKKSGTPAYFKILFDQSWNFFSPNPGVDDIDFMYSCDGGINWEDLNHKKLVKHQENRLLGLGRVLYLTKGLAEDTLRIYEKSYLDCSKKHEECRRLAFEYVFLSNKFKYIDAKLKKVCPSRQFSGYRFLIRINKYGFKKRSLVYLKFPRVTYQ